jgi:hypothetical protein
MARTSASPTRSTEAIFAHHLGAFRDGLDAILSDYVEQSVVLTPDQVLRGLGPIRSFFDGFLKGAAPAFWDAFKIRTRVVEGETAYLVWEARPFVTLATDTFVIRDGKILVQTFTPFTG